MSLLSTFENLKIVHKLGKYIVVGDYFGCPRYCLLSPSEKTNTMDKNLKQEILKLRKQGFSYNKIAEKLNCTNSWEEVTPKDAFDRLKPDEWVLVENIDIRYYKGYCNVDINNRTIKISGTDYYVVKTKLNT